VVKQAFAGTRAFDDFLAQLGISRSRLSDRLNRLVEEGILQRVPLEAHAGRDQYRLTQKGLDLYPIIQALRLWGDRYMAPNGPPLRYTHAGCGGHASLHLTCSECDASLTARDVEVRLGPGFNAPPTWNSGAFRS